jgi:serine/threonine protein kinase/tetratricopeptide (TPR) repeat protein
MSPERWQKIDSIFQTAIDLEFAEREVYLQKQCQDDLQMKSEIEKLLTDSDNAQNFIESPVWTDSRFLNSSAKKIISDSLEEESGEFEHESLIGKRIGVYRLTREIGRGGMGAVFLAERADGEFSQIVAVKLIKRGMDTDFIVRRFRHERQILANIEHPFIARLLDGGTTGEGMPYFVMEFIEGETLYNFCDNRRLNLNERLKIFQKICSAVGYAHENQIIHRDIKPSNILVTKQSAPKLLDFGIAKVLDPNLIHESINPTASMMRLMTPDYASPEQVRGLEVTTSSDIYSLGILLYELLTGHRPYNFSGRALHEVSQVICEVAPMLPSEIIEKDENVLPQYTDSKDEFARVRSSGLQSLKSELAKNLDNIVMKALAKEPSERYLSTQEFSEDITRHLRGQNVQAEQFKQKPKALEENFRTQIPAQSLSSATYDFGNDQNTQKLKKSALHNHTTAEFKAGGITEDTNIETAQLKPDNQRRSFWLKTAAGLIIFFGIVGVLVKTGVLTFSYVQGEKQTSAPNSTFLEPSVIVLPFKSEVSEEKSLGIGLADDLTRKLGNIKRISVLSASSGRVFEKENVKVISEQLGTNFVIRGNLKRVGESASIIAEMIEASSEKVLWSETFVSNDGNLFALQSKLAEKIWTSLGIIPLPLEREQVLKDYTKSSSAYELYLLGLYQMTNRSSEDLHRAISAFNQSLEVDNNFALALVGLADAYVLLNSYEIDPPKDAYPKAEQAALKALSIDDNLAQAHTSLGYIKFYYQRDQSGSELEFRRAVQINPSYAQAHHWFALALMALNRPVEAISELQIAEQLNPRAPIVKTALCMAHFYAEQYEIALKACDQALAINENFVPAYKTKRWIYSAKNDYTNALSAYRKEFSLSSGKDDEPGWKIIKAQVEALNGNHEKVRAELEKSINDPFIKNNAFSFAEEIALAYNALGDKEKTLEWLEKAEAANNHKFNFVNAEPRYANLRNEPRFQNVVKKLQLKRE